MSLSSRHHGRTVNVGMTPRFVQGLRNTPAIDVAARALYRLIGATQKGNSYSYLSLAVVLRRSVANPTCDIHHRSCAAGRWYPLAQPLMVRRKPIVGR
jgi:hypothetical protein